MARKTGKRRRRFRKYLAGKVNTNLSAGMLAAKDLSSVDFADSVTESTWISSVRATYSMINFTKTANSGPCLIGLAHSDYSNAEIEAWLENVSSWEQGNLVQQEVAKRKIRIVGTFDVPASIEESTRLNDGKPIRTKCGWMLMTGQTVQLWAYNMGTAAFFTAPLINAYGVAHLWPA